MTRIFISHSHSDEAIAYKLVNFLLSALKLEEEDILCTSNPDQGLDYSSSSITDQLKSKLKNSEALIILITADSLHSAWIPFEAGSFWTTDKQIIPILGPGLTQNDLPGPLRNFLIIPIEAKDSEDRLNNATNQLAKKLNIQQKVSKRRNYTLQEFSHALKAWQSKRPVINLAQQEEIEELKTQIQESEKVHSQELAKLEVVSQQEKQKLEQKLQQEKSQTVKQLDQSKKLHQKQLQEIDARTQQELEQLEKSFKLQIKQLQQQLTEERLRNQQLTEDDLFLPELKFLDQDDVLPGALFPKTFSLTYYSFSR